MLLAVDIGNTTVALAGLRGDVPAFVIRLPSDSGRDAAAWTNTLRQRLEGEGVDPREADGAVLSSVVPALTRPVTAALASLTGRTPLVVGRTTPTGLDLGGYDAFHLGMDRVVDCVAALARYAPPLAVFDMGTATTLSVVDREGVFRGGMILAGLSLSLDALSARAAQLPPVTLSPPEGLVGTDTERCMRYGAIYGAAGAVEGIAARLEEQFGPLTVVLTGGNGAYVRPLLRIPVVWEPMLTHLGLRELWLRQEP